MGGSKSTVVMERSGKRTDSKRLDFLDSLKAFIIFMVITLHVALAYFSIRFPGWVYNPATNDMLFGVITSLIDGPLLMSVMFFIAGYFTLPSLIKKGPLQFVKGKIIRIFIPWVIGTIILAPLIGCISSYCDGYKGTFADCIVKYFTPSYGGQYHFWFLGVLFYFFLITAGIYVLFNKKEFPVKIMEGKSSIPIFLLFIAIAGGTSFAVSLFNNVYTWTTTCFIQFENIKIPLYIAFFILGIYAYKKNWFLDGYKPRTLPWAIVFGVSYIVCFCLNIRYELNPTTVIGKLLLNMAFSIEVLSYVFLLLSIFRKYFNNAGNKIKTICRCSFGAYIIHMFILLPVLQFTKGVYIPLFIKFLLQTAVVSVLTWTIAYGLKRIPGIRRVM